MLERLKCFFGYESEYSEQFDNIQIDHKFDSFTCEKYHYVSNLSNNSSFKDIEAIKLLMGNHRGLVAKVGSNAIIKINSDELLIFKETSPQLVREVLFNNTISYPYTLTFKVAKFHGYVHLEEKETGISYIFGTAPQNYGSYISTPYIRNDTFYDNKHFRGHIDATNYQEIIDWASIAIGFDITTEQVQELEHYLKQYHASAKEEQYSMFGIIGENCLDFINKVHKKVIGEGHFSDYLIAENLDLNDKGIAYTFLHSHPSYLSFKVVFKLIDNIIGGGSANTAYEFLNKMYLDLNWLGKSFTSIFSFFSFNQEQQVEKIGEVGLFGNNQLHIAAYSEDIIFLEQHLKAEENNTAVLNAQNNFGDTPLHIAAKNNYLFALKMLETGADVNIQNNQGHTPLHSTILTKWNREEKYNLVKMLLEKGANPNYLDVALHSNALVDTLKTDDLELFTLVLKYSNLLGAPESGQAYNHNTGINFINTSGKNLARIAVDKKKMVIKDFLQQNYPELFKQKANDGFTAEEFELELNKWIIGELKYSIKEIHFPFEYNNNLYTIYNAINQESLNATKEVYECPHPKLDIKNMFVDYEY